MTATWLDDHSYDPIWTLPVLLFSITVICSTQVITSVCSSSTSNGGSFQVGSKWFCQLLVQRLSQVSLYMATRRSMVYRKGTLMYLVRSHRTYDPSGRRPPCFGVVPKIIVLWISENLTILRLVLMSSALSGGHKNQLAVLTICRWIYQPNDSKEHHAWLNLYLFPASRPSQPRYRTKVARRYCQNPSKITKHRGSDAQEITIEKTWMYISPMHGDIWPFLLIQMFSHFLCSI